MSLMLGMVLAGPLPLPFPLVSLTPVHSHFDTRVPHGSISPDLLHGLAPQPSPLPSAVVMIKSCV